jgi:hypothetical protein
MEIDFYLGEGGARAEPRRSPVTPFVLAPNATR